jgi:hypothetical protein
LPATNTDLGKKYYGSLKILAGDKTQACLEQKTFYEGYNDKKPFYIHH